MCIHTVMVWYMNLHANFPLQAFLAFNLTAWNLLVYISDLASSNIMLLVVWPSTACTPLPCCCSNIHDTHKCTHHVFYWIVSHFLLSEAYHPFLPLPSCSPPPLSSCLPSSAVFCHSSASLTQSLNSQFFLPLLSLLPLFLPFFPWSVSLYLFFLQLLLFFGPPHWAAGQCGSEAGCNYFTPPLTAIVKEKESES